MAETIKTITEFHPNLNIQFEYVPADDLRKLFPQELPPNWRCEGWGYDGVAYAYEPQWGRRLKVLISSARQLDSRMWLHLSLSKWSPSGSTQVLPSWEDVMQVKEIFLGPLREAYIVLPKRANHVNLGEVHHIWCPLYDDGPSPLPDFTRGMGVI